jgi:hypothetical protein
VEFQIQSLDQRAGASFEDMAHISQPILELRLAVSLLSAPGSALGEWSAQAPPKHPQPQVAAELVVLDAARDKLEVNSVYCLPAALAHNHIHPVLQARFLKGLGGKYMAALDDAKARINALIKCRGQDSSMTVAYISIARRSFGAAHFDARKRCEIVNNAFCSLLSTAGQARLCLRLGCKFEVVSTNSSRWCRTHARHIHAQASYR